MQESKFTFKLTGCSVFYRTVKCTKHNWKLNVSTMKYVNPPDSFLQDELGKICTSALYLVSITVRRRTKQQLKEAIHQLYS